MTNRHTEIVLPDAELQQELKKRSRRGFLVGGLSALGAIGAYKAVRLAHKEDNVPWPQRRVLDLNGRLWRSYVDEARLVPTYSPSQIGFLKPNGQYGLDDEDDSGDKPEWSLQVEPGAGIAPLTLTLADVQALPKQEMITKFCCIEGWSSIQQWGGTGFADFTRKYFPAGRAIPKYVYMATGTEDEGEYFVGLDMKSALHPQTLLAWERNGKPLEEEHGAPLRLVIPVKYGIKNIKRIGLIRYTDQRPADYWAKEGYDWFAGL
jgi:DMSO/TMAO reductase YedYZ molybdopterin-dependent catalytic subunit